MAPTRRETMGQLAAAAVALGLGEARAAKETNVAAQHADFYGPDGKFLADRGKAAYFALMERFGYPIPPSLREGLWAVDFSLGDFTRVGMGGIFWLNEPEYKYFGHEIFLLPHQMIVQHKHIALPTVAPKMESWQVRHGWVHLFAEGPESPEAAGLIPPSQKEFVTARAVSRLMPGEVARLHGPEEWHFMMAGPEGAIVTEYATYHDNAALRFSNPKVAF